MPLPLNVDFIGDLDPMSPGPAEFKSEGDDHLRNVHKSLRQSFPGATGSILVLGAATGPADAYVLTPAMPLVDYLPNTLVACQITAANATTAPTLNISSLGPKTIKAVDGAALAAGDLRANSYQFLLFDGTNFVLQAPTKGYVDRVVAALKAYTDQLALAPAFPNQTGNAGKVATTDGTNVSWQLAIPAQSGKAGKVLGTDGTTAAWRSVLPKVEVIKVSGTWVATSETARITLVGGGESSNTQTGFNRDGGCGAGAGVVTVNSLQIGQAYTIAIGAGGIPPAMTNATLPGNPGGTTSFSGPGITTKTATGGSTTTNGTATNCDIVIPGGRAISTGNGTPMPGGASYLSPGAAPGSNGIGYGAGAGSSTSASGYTGGPGVVIIET